jgi:hypothetical protein
MSSSYADRPAPDPERFLAALDAWRAGDDHAGTAVQKLKRGGFDELATENADRAPRVLAAWAEWERGKVGPAQTLEALEAAGIRDLLAGVIELQREVFGGE